MGRHAASPGPEPVPAPQQKPVAVPVAPAHPVVVWIERILLGLAAGGGICAVLRWAGTSWTAALWVAAVIAVLVPVAAWVAATVPGRDHQHR